MRAIRHLLLAAGVLALVPRPIQAQVRGYKVQTIARLGETIGNLKLAANGGFVVCSLNDAGQLAIITRNAAGGDILFQYSDGKFVPIVVGGRDAPGGKWPRSVAIWGEVDMNPQGDMVFMAGASGSSNLTTYRWSRQSGQVRIIAAAGMPAVNDLTFVAGGDGTWPATNDYGDMVFQARVKDSTGKSQRAIFFLGRDGKLTPVLMAGQTVASVGAIAPSPDGGGFSLNNAGVIGFHADLQGHPKGGGSFVWENGTITPMLLTGDDAPGGGKFVAVGLVHVNNKNRNVWVGGILDGVRSYFGFYWRIDGQLIPIGVPGQEMPGGGTYARDVYHSNGNTGEYALIAELEGGDTGAYRFDADRNLSLIVKGSMLGANLALRGPYDYGLAINDKGEVALPVQFTGDKGSTLILLTPTAP